MDLPIIIIGAGAAGLLAAMQLSEAGFPVTIIEAAASPGGRIRTIDRPSFPFESGAEFIHGQLPITLGLLDKAGIGYRPVKGHMARVLQGKWVDNDIFGDDWDILMEKMGALSQDLPIAAFLEAQLPGERYATLREGVKRFAEGYDLADIQKASTLALYNEWKKEEETQYRIDGGYSLLINYMIEQCRSHGAEIILSSPVENVVWEKDNVQVSTVDGKTLHGRRLLVTVSLGVLQLQPAAIRFSPDIPAYTEAARRLGFGSVIKIIAQFKEPFWFHVKKDLGFVLSDAAVPTWWTQTPDNTAVLTGWLTGTAMSAFQLLSEVDQTDSCLQSLASIFSLSVSSLRELLVTIEIYDWSKAPYIRGGYSYETVDGLSAIGLLRQPIDNTIYFAGEALYTGAALATVEAALCSGRDAAEIVKARS